VPALLELDGVSFSYGQVQVLFDVSIHVEEGEILALLGTNGAGKSTLLRVVSGLCRQTAGDVRLDGESLGGEAAEQRMRRGLALVPGGRGVFPGLTVAENLQAGAFSLRRDRVVARERIDRALERFPVLARCRSRPAGALSGGEQQMLALAKGMLCEPRVLLIDELSLGLSPTVVAELLGMVRQLRETGTSIVLVEQSLNIALALAERAVFMERGQIRFEGPAQDLLARTDLARSIFFGTPEAA
jgi:ABC-type branched-subunit amino acid transport system ATPase component